ncbi:tRNA lysidine(34) synthetase TilS [Acholeplasma equirhinis]|uniref:tRNA lysidine(34) synthetase TilS n=1 Tax=Acholeplasma equirhinis TaxID=555393 RepID=UPI00197AF949|nr:tRNA lysidine(34) synthetase TilS [Acholeplasma equirhinis]MBN3491010.1 tRNA lysidine(34) synthetase TilS [Acholeplasma equirhinis]
MELRLNLPKSNTYIASISGGVDSMVLLDYLIKENYKFIVVHFNHQKRDDANLDHELVQSITSSFNIPYKYFKLNIKSGNFQDEARKERYDLLEKVANEYKTSHIITAHHNDDLLETVLMKITRGSNLLGYSGMQEVTKINPFTYYKPLLKYSKADLISYANNNQVKYRDDSSNFEDDYLRNRIRHHVVPQLNEENDIYTRIRNFSRQVFLASDYIRSQTKSFLGERNAFSLTAFNSLHEAIKWDLISYLLEGYDVQKSYEKISNILKQLASKKPNIEIKLSSKYVLIKAYDLVKIKEFSSTKNDEKVPTLTISHKLSNNPNNSIELCYNELDFPITLRRRKNGDVLSFSYGSKKLKKFLIDKKVPKEQRDSLLIVADNKNRILWIPNLYINQTLGQNNKIYLELEEDNHA